MDELQAMGFPAEWCERALAQCSRPEAAVDLLLRWQGEGGPPAPAPATISEPKLRLQPLDRSEAIAGGASSGPQTQGSQPEKPSLREAPSCQPAPSHDGLSTSDRGARDEQERRYREAMKAKQAKEVEKAAALRRYEEDKAARRAKFQTATPSQTPVKQHQAQSSQASAAAAAALARFATPQAQPAPSSSSPEPTSTSQPSQPQAQTELQIRCPDGRVLKHQCSANTTLQEVAHYVSNQLTSQPHVLPEASAPGQYDYGFMGGRRGYGIPRTVGRGHRLVEPAQREDELELLRQGRVQFEAQTARIMAEAAALRSHHTTGGPMEPARSLPEEAIFFLIPFPRREFFTKAALATTLAQAELVPRGTLAVHIDPAYKSQAQQEPDPDEASATDEEMEDQEDDMQEDNDARCFSGQGQRTGTGGPSAGASVDREALRQRALAAAADRASVPPPVEPVSVSVPVAKLLEVSEAGPSDKPAREGLSDLERQREEVRQRTLQAMQRRMSEEGKISQAKQETVTKVQRGKEVESSDPVEERLAEVRRKEAAKAVERARVKQMLEADKAGRKAEATVPQPMTSPRMSHVSLPELPSNATPAERAAAAAQVRLATGHPQPVLEQALGHEGQQDEPSRTKEGGSCQLRIRLEDGNVVIHSFDAEVTTMRHVRDCVVPDGQNPNEYGLVIPFPEREFFDEGSLGLTLQQAGLAPRGTVHVLPASRRGRIIQATVPVQPRYPQGWRGHSWGHLVEGMGPGAAGPGSQDLMAHWMSVQGNEGAGRDLGYEQLLELQERLGHVRAGLSAELILALPTRKITYKSKDPDENEEGASEEALVRNRGIDEYETCIVCMCEFQEGEDATSLPCLHTYHSDCIGRWLQQSKVCPTCKQSIV